MDRLLAGRTQLHEHTTAGIARKLDGNGALVGFNFLQIGKQIEARTFERRTDAPVGRASRKRKHECREYGSNCAEMRSTHTRHLP